MNWLLQVAGSTALASIVIALINAVMQKRRNDAETGQLSAGATKIITEAASGVVEKIEKDNARLRQENQDLRRSERMLEARVDDLEEDALEFRREREEWRRVLIVHGAWDSLSIATMQRALQMLTDAGIDPVPPFDLPDVPPLTPPVQARPSRRVPLTDGDESTVGP